MNCEQFCRLIAFFLLISFNINQIFLYFESHAATGIGRLMREPSSQRSINVYCAGPVDAPDTPLLFLHGAFDTMHRFHDLMEHYGQTRRVCAWDRAGRGFSSPSNDADRAHLALHDMQFVIEQLRRDNDLPPSKPVTLIGHSLGGLLAVAFAYQHPNDVAGLVLLDPPPVLNARVPKLFAKMSDVWRVLFPAMSAFAAVGGVRLQNAIFGTDGYMFDTHTKDIATRKRLQRVFASPTYFRASLLDTMKTLDTIALVNKLHDEVVRARLDNDNEQGIAAPVMRISSDFSDAHDIPFADVKAAEVQALMHEADQSKTAFAGLAIGHIEFHHLSATDDGARSPHVFVSLSPWREQTIALIDQFLQQHRI